MAQDICAQVEPPLLQIGGHHKVACHFAGEQGAMATSPVTLSALGVDGRGNKVSGAAASVEDYRNPGFADSWTTLEEHKSASASLVGAGGIGAGMTDEQRGEGGQTR
jgi:peptide/nickel transport system ATP-binding protein/oligopeptide transport system ATP-binding protein